MNELGSDNLFECENCGRVWDGAAQCTCYADGDDDVLLDSCPTTPHVPIPPLSSPPRIKEERRKRRRGRPASKSLRECARLFQETLNPVRPQVEPEVTSEVTGGLRGVPPLEETIGAFLERYPFCACPRSGELMREPVVTPEGVTYDKKSLPESFEQNLVPNAVMSTVISSLLETFVV